MKRLMFIALALVSISCMLSASARCEEVSVEDIIKELGALKERIGQLEKNLAEKDQEIEALKKQTSHIIGHPEERLPLKTEEDKKALGLSDRIKLSGIIEAEFGSDKHKVNDPATGRHTGLHDDDITLATVELGVDADINTYTKGRLLFLYEEDEDEDRVRIDEGTIKIGGADETFGLYVLAGKYYPHFGELKSWFISDPLNLEIFEIRESAAQIGCEKDWFTAGIGAFHGDIQETGRDESRIKGFFADASFHNPENTLKGISLLLGASYLSNVADTDTLQDENHVDLDVDGNPDMRIKDYVDGIAAYLVAEYSQFSFVAEYMTALDDFMAGEMAYAMDRNGIARSTRPAAWNFEVAFRPVEVLQVAVKYEGTDDMFGLFPEKQYGGVISWELFKYTVLSAEYLHGTYDKNNRNADGLIEDNRDVVTVQVAVEF